MTIKPIVEKSSYNYLYNRCYMALQHDYTSLPKVNVNAHTYANYLCLLYNEIIKTLNKIQDKEIGKYINISFDAVPDGLTIKAYKPFYSNTINELILSDNSEITFKEIKEKYSKLLTNDNINQFLIETILESIFNHTVDITIKGSNPLELEDFNVKNTKRNLDLVSFFNIFYILTISNASFNKDKIQIPLINDINTKLNYVIDSICNGEWFINPNTFIFHFQSMNKCRIVQQLYDPLYAPYYLYNNNISKYHNHVFDFSKFRFSYLDTDFKRNILEYIILMFEGKLISTEEQYIEELKAFQNNAFKYFVIKDSILKLYDNHYQLHEASRIKPELIEIYEDFNKQFITLVRECINLINDAQYNKICCVVCNEDMKMLYKELYEQLIFTEKEIITLNTYYNKKHPEFENLIELLKSKLSIESLTKIYQFNLHEEYKK